MTHRRVDQTLDNCTRDCKQISPLQPGCGSKKSVTCQYNKDYPKQSFAYLNLDGELNYIISLTAPGCTADNGKFLELYSQLNINDACNFKI